MSRSKIFAELASQDVSKTEFNKLDGVTASTTELNVVTGGITTLGAVTAGTLGSNVVFPAGHILGSACIVNVTNDNDGSSTGSNTLRVLNNVLYEVGLSVTLASSEWTFDEAGSYLISASAPGYGSNGYIVRLYSGTGSTLEATGTSEGSGPSSATQTRSFLNTKVVILDSQKTSGASEKSFGLYTIVESPRSVNGLGISNGDTTVEQHTQVQIFKIQE